MAQIERINVLLPVGRLTNSNMYEPRMVDGLGQPRLYKNGDKAGQPRPDFGITVAIPKTQAHWANEVSADPNVGAWGMAIWNKGHGDFPQGQGQSPTFAWKITDGDSAIPNSRGNKPCDNPNWKGCWVIHVSSDRAPVIVNRDGSARVMEVNAVKPGYYVQASINVRGNDNTTKPGIYVGLNAVSLQAIGEEIVFGINPAAVGFGGSAAPAGAQPVPAGYGQAMPPSAAAVPATPGVPAATAAVPPSAPVTPVAVAAPAVPTAVPTPAVPNPGFVQQAIAPPAAPVAPPAAPVAPAQPRMVGTPKLSGATIEQYKDAGWTDAQLIEHGYAVMQ